MNLTDKKNIENCLPKNVEGVKYSKSGLLQFFHGNGIIHKSIDGNLKDFELYYSKVDLINQNKEISISLLFTFKTDNGNMNKILVLNLKSTQEVTDFIENHRKFKYEKLGW